MVVGGRSAVRGAQKLAFMWLMNENLGGMARGTGTGCFPPRFWRGLGSWRAYGDEASDAPFLGMHPLPPPTGETPPKGMSRGPRDQLNNLGEVVPRAAFIP